MLEKILKNIRTGILGLTLASSVIACQFGRPPVELTPPLLTVYEGTEYNCLVQFSGGDSYSIKVNPLISSSPSWNSFTVEHEGNGVYISGGNAPQVDNDTEYNAEIDASNAFGTTVINYIIIDKNVK